MKCSWQTFLSPLKGQCPQYALIGLSQTTRLTGGFDYAKSWENFRFFEDGLEFAFFAEKG